MQSSKHIFWDQSRDGSECATASRAPGACSVQATHDGLRVGLNQHSGRLLHQLGLLLLARLWTKWRGAVRVCTGGQAAGPYPSPIPPTPHSHTQPPTLKTNLVGMEDLAWRAIPVNSGPVGSIGSAEAWTR